MLISSMLRCLSLLLCCSVCVGVVFISSCVLCYMFDECCLLLMVGVWGVFYVRKMELWVVIEWVFVVCGGCIGSDGVVCGCIWVMYFCVCVKRMCLVRCVWIWYVDARLPIIYRRPGRWQSMCCVSFNSYVVTSQMYPVIFCVSFDQCLFSCVALFSAPDHISNMCVCFPALDLTSLALVSNNALHSVGALGRVAQKMSNLDPISGGRGKYALFISLLFEETVQLLVERVFLVSLSRFPTPLLNLSSKH